MNAVQEVTLILEESFAFRFEKKFFFGSKSTSTSDPDRSLDLTEALFSNCNLGYMCVCVCVNSFPVFFLFYFRVNLDLQKSCDDNTDNSHILQKEICSTINILYMYNMFNTINCPRSIVYY